ncbi:hypothetical protein AFEL58S_00189 [Afipia felis]
MTISSPVRDRTCPRIHSATGRTGRDPRRSTGPSRRAGRPSGADRPPRGCRGGRRGWRGRSRPHPPRPPDHADRSVAMRIDGAGEGGDRRPASSAASRDQVVADVPGRDDVDREWQHVRRHQPGEVFIHGLGLPARVGEDRAIGHRPDIFMRSQKGERRRLHAGAETEHAQADRGGLALPRYKWSGKHHAASTTSSDCG